ncbi:MAG: hypothetical protein HC843_07655 [Sphingomonadales bacterium]|nr:hypothetical protein [Sphingomonadales bacterium]
MSFFKDASPTGGITDLIAYLRERRQYNWFFWAAACLPPAIMVYMFQNDMAVKSVPPPPKVVYFESWPADRTREETIKDITARQAKKDAFLEEKRKGYEALGRAMGMDVEEIKREAEQIRAEARAAAAKAEAAANAAASEPANTAKGAVK